MTSFTRQKRRQRLVDLLGRLMTVSGVVGYCVGVVGTLVIMHQMGYSIWILILFIPVALIGSIGYGIPIGLIAGMPFMLLLARLIKWLYPEDMVNPADEE